MGTVPLSPKPEPDWPDWVEAVCLPACQSVCFPLSSPSTLRGATVPSLGERDKSSQLQELLHGPRIQSASPALEERRWKTADTQAALRPRDKSWCPCPPPLRRDGRKSYQLSLSWRGPIVTFGLFFKNEWNSDTLNTKFELRPINLIIKSLDLVL